LLADMSLSTGNPAFDASFQNGAIGDFAVRPFFSSILTRKKTKSSAGLDILGSSIR
jgi:hypothetical protein